jgi:hypothetical protein
MPALASPILNKRAVSVYIARYGAGLRLSRSTKRWTQLCPLLPEWLVTIINDACFAT